MFKKFSLGILISVLSLTSSLEVKAQDKIYCYDNLFSIGSWGCIKKCPDNGMFYGVFEGVENTFYNYNCPGVVQNHPSISEEDKKCLAGYKFNPETGEKCPDSYSEYNNTGTY